MTAEKPTTGRCSCNSVSYEFGGEPSFSILCQCRQCQKISGAGHTASFLVEESAITVRGDIRYFELSADSGSTIRSGFCPTCGNPILKTTSRMPDKLFVHAATLDDPTQFQPELVVFEDSRAPWDLIDPKVPRER